MTYLNITIKWHYRIGMPKPTVAAKLTLNMAHAGGAYNSFGGNKWTPAGVAYDSQLHCESASRRQSGLSS
jgi:hypothetical protein